MAQGGVRLGPFATLMSLLLPLLAMLTGCAALDDRYVRLADDNFQQVWVSPEAWGTAEFPPTPLGMRSMPLSRQESGVWSYEFTCRGDTTFLTFNPDSRFNELLVSWNIHLQPGAGAVVDLRVGPLRGAEWSPWLRLGTCGTADGAPGAVREFFDGSESAGRIDIDCFRTDRTYRYFAVRVTAPAMTGAPPDVPPARIDRLAFWQGNTLETWDATRASRREGCPTEVVANPVPFRSQATDNPALSGRLCSPTSLAMVLAFHGVNRSVGDVASAVRDPEFDIYGNWPRNIQAAYESGVPGYLTRFDHWETVCRHLARGEPIIASIRAPRGVLTNAPYTELDSGHLIVITGFDGRGGVFVNDPAAGTAADGQRVYSMDELAKAWFELGRGTAYVLLRPVAGEARP